MKRNRIRALAFAAGLAAASAGPAATFTVVNSNASGLGSLRQAIEDANAAAGKDTIAFDIPGSGAHTIDCGPNPLPALTAPVDIDGTTQPGYAGTPLIVLRGSHDLSARGLDVQGGNSTVRALAVTRWGIGIFLASAGNTVEDCYIGTDETGEDPDLSKLDDNSIGIRVDAIGSPANNQIVRNLVSANGTGIQLLTSDATQIRANRIGTNGGGTTVLGNSVGILINGSTNVQIGDGTVAGRNVVSGNGFGIQFTGGGAGSRIRGNFIGPNAAGTGPLLRTGVAGVPLEVGNFLDGILVNVPAGSAIQVGGSGASPSGEGNLIAYNRRDGVRVQQGTRVSIRGNRIFSNAPAPPSTAAALGVNLGTDAATANDADDVDNGPNLLQNFPVLATAGSAGGVTAVTGALNTVANLTFTIDFYASASCDPSGNGEGERFLGSTSVTTDSAGDASIGAATLGASSVGEKVTATATDPDGNTSEFSPCVTVTAGPRVAPVALVVDPAPSAISDGGGILEPGETASAEPVWRNLSSTDPVGLAGAASDFQGPTGPVYAIADGAADYGTIPAAAGRSCSGAPTPNCYALHVDAVVARPATHWDAEFRETPGTGDPAQTWKVHIGASFTDVLPFAPASVHAPAAGNPFYAKIETLLHNGITLGCGSTTYCPGDAVKRDQMVIFIARGLIAGGSLPQSGTANGKPYNCSPGGASIYDDVLPTDSHCRAAHYLAAQNVTLGCSATSFCGKADVTRDAMAAFLARGLVAPGGGPAVPISYGPDPVTGFSYDCSAGSPNLNFTDVPVSNSFCKHIHYLWARGIVAGCGGDMYCPTDLVTRDAMAKFLANTFRLGLYAP